MVIIKAYFNEEQLRLNRIVKDLLKQKNKQFLIDIANGHLLGVFEYKPFKEKPLKIKEKVLK